MVIGLDGATLQLVKPWAAEGRLPNLAEFLASGAAGALRSTLPPDSPTAWSTFATGLNPGQHGVLSFYQWRPDAYKPEVMNASRRRGATFWEIAGRHGIRGGVLNVPVTFPPRAYNGFLISGLLTPTVGRRMASPPEIFDDLKAASPRYAIDVDMIAGGGRDPETFLRQVLANLQARVEAALGLYSRHRPALFCVVFVAADRICHYFWPFLEAARAGRAVTAAQKRLGGAIQRVYEELDKAVGALVAAAGDDTDVIVMSDHGAGGLRKRLDLRNLLAREGLLVKRPARPAEGLRRYAVSVFAHHAPPALKRWSKSLFPMLAHRAVGILAAQGIDFHRTKAYPAGATQGVFVNLRGRQPSGIVEPGADYESVRDRIIAVLSGLCDPDTGRPVARAVYRREEVWSGECLGQLPDVIMEQEDNVYSVPMFVQGGSEDVFCPLPELNWSALQPLGGHRRDGLLLARGPHIRRAEPHGANMADVPATILALLGCPIPENFDGRVLSEILTDDVMVTDRTARADAGGEGADGLTEQERAAVEKRLRGLGYV